MPIIVVDRITKSFQVPGSKGLTGAVKSLLQRERETVEAIQEMSFAVNRGEILGIVGPAGSGKTVLLKMLSGILAPSSGDVFVDGATPYDNKKQNAMRVGAVFDVRTHLHWNESLWDIFDLHQAIYRIPSFEFQKNRSRLIELFELGQLMSKAPDGLTVGQKVRANVALSMLHSPDVLYLDNPMAQNPYTKRILREGIRTIGEEWNAAVVFSTQVLRDIAPVCERMLLLDEGALLYDGSCEKFSMQYQAETFVAMEFDAAPQWKEHPRFSLAHAAEGKWIVRVSPGVSTKDAFLALSHLYSPHSITLCEQRIDDIVSRMKKIRQEAAQAFPG